METLILSIELGDATTVTATAGETLMRIALDNGITGTSANCGVSTSCGISHVYVAPQSINWCPMRGKTAEELLAVEASELRNNYRPDC
ncbi:2Fe-2S iron-sulfur cluster-binding protein [Rhodopseudomonas sp. P2A-2r]|uniref:2Fe-2S iron-sulfur cluster-binding protein n=1 Tax=unclassified Rhodopseudomonas TaxID=2638247 RepID=UPI0022344B16|nr:2Fe-2S iron-sulfur cluster-binding protein [Rhodopseudomonas sp. P2A-2r]UZE50682.1 2Fe-2S iron-sulfur cluster-binding protein [Rhodopseudomonas sp. P2A-2r]